MHPLLQAKLLRAIQERVIDRVGGKEPVKIDVRIIATSNRNLEDSVKKGEFREDLYFRLNVVNLRLPALRERPSDILPLSQFFADKYAEANGVAKKKISKEAETKLSGYYWRGNIRELENTMHRAILISVEAEIEEDAIHLNEAMSSNEVAASPNAAPDPSGVSSGSDNVSGAEAGGAMVGKTVADVEKNLILNTLDHCLGNRTQAAKILGISIRTLRNKLNQYQDDGANIAASQS